MKKIVSTFQRYKYLIAISVCSALMVVFLQTLANTIFPPNSQSMQNIYLEQATGEIIPMTGQQTTNQLKSTLQANELKEFQTNGQYEDKLAPQAIKRIDVQLENLLVVLDKPANPQAHDNGVNMIMNLGHTVDVDISLCTTTKQNKQLCTIYLVDKSGHSIPVDITLLSSTNRAQSTIHLSLSDNTERYSSIFSGEPVELDIRAM